MKFSSALQFNSVPEWADYYISYSNLKKLLYQIEKEVFTSPSYHVAEQREGATVEPVLRRTSMDLPEDSSLLEPGARCRALFLPALNIELKKITDFYTRKEAELYTKYHQLRVDVQDLVHPASVLIPAGDHSSHLHGPNLDKDQTSRKESSHYTSPDDFHSHSSVHPTDIHSVHDRVTTDSTNTIHSGEQDIPYRNNNPNLTRNNTRVEDINVVDDGDDESLASSPRHSIDMSAVTNPEYRRKLCDKTRDLFIVMSDLKSYGNLNFTGFSKILKKYDKVTHSALKESYIENSLRPAYPFREETRQSLNQHILSLQRLYAELGEFSDMESAARELRSCLREQVVWERNTVWRDMIKQERKVGAVEVRPPSMVTGEAAMPAKPTSFLQRWLPFANKQLLSVTISTAIFAILLSIQLFENPTEQNCLALLIYVSLLWATEALPLFVTALLVPLLTVLLRVLQSDGPDPQRLSARDTAETIFGAMFTPVVMLLLGGFAIAAAVSKHNIAKTVASLALSLAGTKPRNVLLMNMVIATVASMLISNVAAPVLCFSLIQPTLRTLPPGSPFARALIIGIALAANVGGMSSPISSPQNTIAIDNMDPNPNWGQWFAVALPVSLACDILIWLFLLFVYKPADTTPAVHQARYVHEPFKKTQWFIIGVTCATIVLWCVESAIRGTVGHMGVIAVLPLLLFFGTGILTKEDFNNFLWTTIMLAMGGIALGRAVKSSGLLLTIAVMIKHAIQDYSFYAIFVIFNILMLVIATFISHTVAAFIILPVVKSVGDSLPDNHSRLLVFGSVLMCSGAMGLPVSGFPNMTAIMMEDETGKPYLTTKDFLVAGIPSSVIAFGLIITVGYGILALLGF
ncbi:low-affinity phosphate transporter [Dispira parvispora]|uniref:Low-affinity phosphate transporter n=1 Tax=Dispira parvispora TaxID=1520584 RepID=A0A9W8B1C7_9FUNG|nr:low-affinity phosphate transporter [Dispira parvispora]